MTALVAAWYLTFVYPGAMMGRQYGPFENEEQCMTARKRVVDALKVQYSGWTLNEKQGVCFQGVSKP